MAFKDTRCSAVHLLPVLFLLAIMCTIWLSYIVLHLQGALKIGVLPDAFDEVRHRRAVAEAVISQTLAALLFISFVRAVLTDPGSVPDTPEWRPEIRNCHAGSSMVPTAIREVKSRNGAPRWCKHCLHWKPDRAHHCRVCKSCVLRMDHHCPWIANCVGFRNYKFFLLLAFYGELNCLFVAVTMLESVTESLVMEASPARRFMLVLTVTLSVILGILLAAFLWFHCWLMSKAMSTIEFCETRHKEWSSASMLSYDFGVYQNIRGSLGENPLFWLLPISPPQGDGLSYASNSRRKSMQYDAESEPLMKHEEPSPEPSPEVALKEPADVPPEIAGGESGDV